MFYRGTAGLPLCCPNRRHTVIENTYITAADLRQTLWLIYRTSFVDKAKQSEPENKNSAITCTSLWDLWNKKCKSYLSRSNEPRWCKLAVFLLASILQLTDRDVECDTLCHQPFRDGTPRDQRQPDQSVQILYLSIPTCICLASAILRLSCLACFQHQLPSRCFQTLTAPGCFSRFLW